MKLSIINGSPRGKSSNSRRILEWITDGLEVYSAGNMEYLTKIGDMDTILKRCSSSDSLLLCLPLYVDSMPAQQKLFFEKMELEKEAFKGKKISFIIHSGFPEMVQNESLKEYLELFATEIMEMELLGVVIIAGSEALQMAPDNLFKRHIKILQDVIRSIDSDTKFPDDINIRINRRERLTWLQRFLFIINPLKNFYWHYRASKHDHKVKIKAQPYINC